MSVLPTGDNPQSRARDVNAIVFFQDGNEYPASFAAEPDAKRAFGAFENLRPGRKCSMEPMPLKFPGGRRFVARELDLRYLSGEFQPKHLLDTPPLSILNGFSDEWLLSPEAWTTREEALACAREHNRTLLESWGEDNKAWCVVFELGESPAPYLASVELTGELGSIHPLAALPIRIVREPATAEEIEAHRPALVEQGAA